MVRRCTSLFVVLGVDGLLALELSVADGLDRDLVVDVVGVVAVRVAVGDEHEQHNPVVPLRLLGVVETCAQRPTFVSKICNNASYKNILDLIKTTTPGRTGGVEGVDAGSAEDDTHVEDVLLADRAHGVP